MADAQGVYVGEGTKELVHVKLHEDHWHLLTLSHVVARHFGDSIRYKLQHQVEINVFFWLADKICFC